MCHFAILENAPFSGLKVALVLYLIKCSTFLENRCYFGEKVSGTSAITAVIYAGTSQSYGLAREFVARELAALGTLYQSCRRSSCLVASLQRLLSFPESSELVY